MKNILLLALAAMVMGSFAETEYQPVSGMNIIAPIPPEAISQYEMKVVIYNEATRSHNDDIKKLTDAGWFVHSIRPFGWRIGAASNAAYKEDLIIVYIRPKTTEESKKK